MSQNHPQNTYTKKQSPFVPQSVKLKGNFTQPSFKLNISTRFKSVILSASLPSLTVMASNITDIDCAVGEKIEDVEPSDVELEFIKCCINSTTEPKVYPGWEVAIKLTVAAATISVGIVGKDKTCSFLLLLLVYFKLCDLIRCHLDSRVYCIMAVIVIVIVCCHCGNSAK